MYSRVPIAQKGDSGSLVKSTRHQKFQVLMMDKVFCLKPRLYQINILQMFFWTSSHGTCYPSIPVTAQRGSFVRRLNLSTPKRTYQRGEILICAVVTFLPCSELPERSGSVAQGVVFARASFSELYEQICVCVFACA